MVLSNPKAKPNACMWKFCLFRANFPTPKGMAKCVREHQDHTENESTPEMPTEGFGGSQNIHDKYMPCEMNMLTMNHVHSPIYRNGG